MMDDWKCKVCNSSEKPPGMQNPSLCRECRSKKLREAKQEYQMICEDCGDKFTARVKNAKRCEKCRKERKNMYFERQESYREKEKETYYTNCEDCREYKPAGFEEAPYCLDCWIKHSDYKKHMDKHLEKGYRMVLIDGMPSVVKVIFQADDYEELYKKADSLLKKQGKKG